MSAFGISSSSAAADKAFLPVSVQLPGAAKKLDIIDDKGNLVQPQNTKKHDPAATQEENMINQLRQESLEKERIIQEKAANIAKLQSDILILQNLYTTTHLETQALDIMESQGYTAAGHDMSMTMSKSFVLPQQREIQQNSNSRNAASPEPTAATNPKLNVTINEKVKTKLESDAKPTKTVSKVEGEKKTEFKRAETESEGSSGTSSDGSSSGSGSESTPQQSPAKPASNIKEHKPAAAAQKQEQKAAPPNQKATDVKRTLAQELAARLSKK